MRGVIIILLFCMNYSGFAQAKVEQVSQEIMLEVLDKLGSFYKNTPSYKFDIIYYSYKGHKSLTPFEESFGSLVKSDKKIKSEVMGIETIQFDDLVIMVQQEENKVMITNKQEENDVLKIDELKLGLKKVEQITKSVLGNITTYYLNHRSYDAVYQTEIHLMNNEKIEKIVFYFNKESEWETESGEVRKAKPRLEIWYKNFSQKLIPNDYQFTIADYVQMQKNTIQLNQKYRGYQLLDLRTKK